MCNFVLRPIKSYATVAVEVNGELVVGEGSTVTPLRTTEDGVVVNDGAKEVTIPFEQYVHSFTADPADVKRVKDKEAKWFPKTESK